MPKFRLMPPDLCHPMRNLLIAVLSLTAATATAQELKSETIHPAIVVMDDPTEERLARAYNMDQERLYCVTRADTTVQKDYDLIVVRSLEETAKGTHTHIEMPVSACRDKDGKMLPILHTHPRAKASCQASPADQNTAMERMAQFDIIQCDSKTFTAYFAKDLKDAQRARIADEIQAMEEARKIALTKP